MVSTIKKRADAFLHFVKTSDEQPKQNTGLYALYCKEMADQFRSK